MRVRVEIEVPDEQWFKFTGLAYHYGYAREDPRKAWTEREKKEALRLVAQKLVSSRLNV